MSADGQRTKWCRNIAENFNLLSREHERYRQTTDRRQTDGRWHIANVNLSSRSLINEHYYYYCFADRSSYGIKMTSNDRQVGYDTIHNNAVSAYAVATRIGRTQFPASMIAHVQTPLSFPLVSWRQKKYQSSWCCGRASDSRSRGRGLAGSGLGRALRRKNSGQVPHTYMVSPWWVTVIRVNHLSNEPPRSTQPCIPPGSLNRVPASAGVKAGMSPLPGGR